MTYRTYCGTVSLALGLVGASVAQADVTAENVWESWQEVLERSAGSGSNVTFESEEETEDGLKVSGLRLVASDGDMEVTSEIGDVSFVETGDGRVRIESADAFAIALQPTETEEEDAEVSPLTMTLRQQDATTIVSGTPEAMTYDYSAGRLSLEVDPAEDFDGAEISEAGFTLSNPEGSFSTAGGDPRRFSSSLRADGAEFALTARDIDLDETVSAKASLDAFSTEGHLELPADMEKLEGSDPFTNGFGFAMEYNFGPSEYDFAFTEAEHHVTASGQLASSQFMSHVEDGRMLYSGEARDITVSAEADRLPAPIDATLGTYRYEWDIPLAPSEDPEPFKVGLGLVDLKVNDEVWNIVDPQGRLARDPATVELGVSGAMRLMSDVMDPDSPPRPATSPLPFEPDSVSLDLLNVDVAGARLTGEGAFDFDAEDTESFGGMPAPEGAATFRAEGVHELLDALVELGLLTEDQVMGPRMMLGMFARPTEDGGLTSKIEVDDQGHILANGQRIR